MDLDIDALIKRTKLALQGSRIIESSDYVQPLRTTFCFEFLANQTIHRTNFVVMHHVWLPDLTLLNPVGACIVHGHTSNETCNSPHFCHHYGYWPTELHSPRFLLQFELKWKRIYQKKGWIIP